MATKKQAAAKGPLRIRMYRVGFGDFFLMSVPSKAGPQHVLIDCGVTTGKTGKGDIGTIKEAVAHMAKETGQKLALIIVTHRHKDHIIGFSRCAEVFEKFAVDAIWMPVWETEYDANVSGFQAELTSLALDVQQHLALAADGSAESGEMLAMLENATGAAFGLAGTGGGTNAASLTLLKEKLGVKPSYYHKGQKAKLPKGLVEAGLEAEILGPPPTDALAFMKLKDLRKGVGQFLQAAEGRTEGGPGFRPFGEQWTATATDYPASAFREWSPRRTGGPVAEARYHEPLQQAVEHAQPGVLLTAVKALDNFLNNQSLVVLFTFRGKKLLFAGDAQAGNWEYWLYDADAPVKAPTGALGVQGTEVLGHLDFYKVGHHGSTNATPIAAVGAMNAGFVAMCSTQADTFGSVDNDSEVPREPLIDALATKSTMVRSDQVPVKLKDRSVEPVKGSPKKLKEPKRGKLVVGSCHVDYLL